MTTPDRPGRKSSPTGPDPARGPVPAREMMKTTTPEAEPAAGTGSGGDDLGLESTFDNDDGSWIARSTGAGAYGTGRTGTAKLVAIHFFREAAPETPVREALVPAGSFPHLRPEELAELFERATPIDLDR